MTSILRIAAFGLALAGAPVWVQVHADQPDANSGGQSSPSNLSIEKLNKEFQDLSPAARDALMRLLKQRGIGGLSHMSENDARTAFAGLPPDVRTELQAKWDQMSDEDHEALKKLNPDTVEQMVEDRLKDSFKPSRTIMEMMEKAKAATEKIRDTLKAYWAKLTGKTNPSGDRQPVN
jgi:hypothetical protein